MMRKLLLAALLLTSAPAWATWTYQSTGTVASDTDTRIVGSGINVTNPSGLASGDNVILYCSFRNGSASTWTTPSDWTVLKTQAGAGTAESVAWARTADSTMVTLGLVNVTGSGSGNARCFMLRFTGGPASDYSTGVVSAGQSNSSAVDIATPARTISVDGTLVLIFAENNANDAASGVNSYPASAANRVNSASSFGSNEFSLYAGTLVQTTATNIASGSIDLVSTGSGASISMVISLPNGSTPPTFSVAPAIGTRTTSTIPVTATTACTDCNYYGVAVTDGSGAPTCTQIKAGQNSGGTSAYKAFGPVAMTTTVQNTGTFSSYTDGTIRDGYFCLNSTADGDSSVSSIADMYKLPAFSSGPTFSSCSATGCTYGLTLDGPGTVYGVACKADLTAATVTQVEAAQCTGGAAATASANKAVTGADTLVIGSALDYPIHDFAIVGTYGSQHEAAIHADNARLKSAPSGYIYDTLASVSATSWCNAISSPATVATDVVELTSPTAIAGQTVAVDGTCDWAFSNSGARDRICARDYDRSAQDWMSITSPSASCSGTRAAIWYQNQAPVFSPNAATEIFKTGIAYSADICARATDAEGDALTLTVTTGTLTTGLSLGGTGNCVVSGTVANGNENEAGNTVVFTATDIAGDTATYTLTMYPLNTITVPTCIGEQAGAYQSALSAIFVPSAITAVAYSLSVPAGNIINCSPAAGQEVDPFTGEVDLTMSLGRAVGKGRKSGMGFGFGVH